MNRINRNQSVRCSGWLLLCAGFLAVAGIIRAQPAMSQTLTARAYSTGNYIFCGRELPKGFSYLVERETGGKWEEVARLTMPQNISEYNARILSLPGPVGSVNRLAPEETAWIWQRLDAAGSVLDSLYGYADRSACQFMAGCGWFDDGITRPGTYHYRVSRIADESKVSESREVSVSYPPERLDMTAEPVSYQLDSSRIELRYQLGSPEKTAGLRIFRSPYLQNSFKEIFPSLSFRMYKGRMVAACKDDKAVPGMTYSYVAVPHDDLGNPGIPSDTLNVHFVSKDADLGLVTGLNVTSLPEERGNLLKWDFIAATYVHTVGIYRSKTYDGNYELVAALKPDVKEYLDTYNISPAESYFYFIVLNDGFGNSVPSARFPAILEGRRPNPVAPQALSVSRAGNVVTLTFHAVGNDIRGAYVYRADGYDAPLLQLPRMVLSTDEVMTYTDTLPLSRHSGVYSYAVASINTSYAVSPRSGRVSIPFSGGMLPIPDRVDGRLAGKSVWLVWSDVSERNPDVTGYQIFRSSRYDDPQSGREKKEEERMIATVDSRDNAFIDSLVVPGRDYVYRVRAIAFDTTDVSGFSLPFGIYTPGGHILPPADLMAFANEENIVLQWNMPITEGIEGVMVYRGEENGAMEPLETLPADRQRFTDTTARKGVMYYYFVVVQYKDGVASGPSGMASAKMD